MKTEGAPPRVGDLAPDFTLADQHGQPVHLAELRGTPVVLVFFPFVFTPTCTGELCELRDDRALASSSAKLLAISCDPSAAQREFADINGVKYSLLSDFWPHGEVSRSYGVFLPERGFATRGTFLLDADGVVRWSVVNGPGEARAITAYLRALDEL